ncbi:hypothetical protein [Brachybacterium hainanense]|uniref:Secreted protein n=1 Tax=Brachybacterium hainanense TaxID=1541174 RepID=A0ABV6R8S1_9MICO
MSTTDQNPDLPPRPALGRRSLLRGAGLLGASTLLGAGSATLTAAPALAADGPERILASDFVLEVESEDDLRVDALLAQAGRASIGEVMDAANHRRTPARAITGQVHGFRFAPGDEDDESTYPQGIATSRDAVGAADGGRYGGRQLIAVSFYEKSPKGSRITLIDWDADHPNRYRRVLLVEPTGTPAQPSFRDVPVHAGGIVWFGDHLYVADTEKGLRVFDMRRILRADTAGPHADIGRVDGAFRAHRHAFALPQVGTIRRRTAEGTEPLLFSTISLDRADRSLVATEYRCDSCPQYPGGTTRAVRFPFAPGTDTFAARTAATEALEVPLQNLNGVGSHNRRWWFNDSRRKTLHHWTGKGAMSSYAWVSWGQSLSYWEDPDGPDLLWSLREEVGDRTVFAVKQADYSS